MRSKGQISLYVNFKDFYAKLCVCSHKQKIDNILNRIFILLPRSCPGVGLLGAGGVKNLGMGICDGAPSTACSSLSFKLILTYCTAFYKLSMRIKLTIFDVSIKEKRVNGCLCFEFLLQQISQSI